VDEAARNGLGICDYAGDCEDDWWCRMCEGDVDVAGFIDFEWWFLGGGRKETSFTRPRTGCAEECLPALPGEEAPPPDKLVAYAISWAQYRAADVWENGQVAPRSSTSGRPGASPSPTSRRTFCWGPGPDAHQLRLRGPGPRDL